MEFLMQIDLDEMTGSKAELQET